jgi:CRP/FNR family transcriptional regulator, cyclic AMP receptor protein
MEITLKERLPRLGIFEKAVREQGALDLLLAILKPRRFAAGSVIFEEGSHGNEMYVLHRGRVRIQKRTPQGQLYTVVLLDDGHDAFFGEAALMEPERRSATVVAEVDTECFTMTTEDFVRLGDEHSRIGLLVTREIANLLAARLRKANQDLVTLFTALVTEVEGDLGSCS